MSNYKTFDQNIWNYFHRASEWDLSSSTLKITDLGKLIMWVHCWHRLQTPTHIHPHASALSLLCRRTDMANLIAWLSPRVSFSTGAFQLLPEPTSIYSGREEASRGRTGQASSFSTKHQTAWHKQRTNSWLIGFHLILGLLTQSFERQDPASIWAHSVKKREAALFGISGCLFCSSTPGSIHCIN